MGLSMGMEANGLARTAVDAEQSLLTWRPCGHMPNVIPVSQLVTCGELLRGRSGLEIDVTHGRWPH